MQVDAVSKRIIEELTQGIIIQVPTFRDKPLRMLRLYNNNGTLAPKAESTPPLTKQDSLYSFSLLTNRLDVGERYALNNVDDDNSDTTDNEAERRTRYPVEVHPTHHDMLGRLLRDIPDDDIEEG